MTISINQLLRNVQRFTKRSLFITGHLPLVFTLASHSVYAQNYNDKPVLNISSFDITGDNPIGDKAFEVLKPYLGHQGIEGLSVASSALEQAIKSEGFGFHRVNLPPQTLNKGMVTLQIIRFNIGNINVNDNKFFNEKNILKSIPLLIEGESPNTTKLSQSIKFANQHPDKNITVEFTRGAGNNEIDSNIHVIEKSPQTTFLSVENTGSVEAESLRATIGYQHSNLFNKDHNLILTFTTTPEDTGSAQQYGLRYRIPIYSQSTNISFLIAESESSTGTLADDSLITGKGSLKSFEYTHQLDSRDFFEHKVVLGLSHKLFDNELFGINRKVLSMPIKTGYRFSNTQVKTSFSGDIDLTLNIPSGQFNDADAYELARTGAENSWWAGHYDFSWRYSFSNSWQFISSIHGQISNELLIPGEQFGLGGLRTLRGFEERSINGDEGYRYKFELWTADIHFTGFKYVLFYDSAHIKKYETSSILNDGFEIDLKSAGLGIRWNWEQSASLKLDYGSILKGGGADNSVNQDGDNKLHFSIVYKF